MKALKRTRKFKRIIPFAKVDRERVYSVQLNAFDSGSVDVIFKQGCLKLKRTVIVQPGDLDQLCLK
ncbi:hypothetical protein [Spirosoma sp.]|uniref:hypothetical protein n=1 Tax=Spirosoma sp. TaxID=1899569 RepID=UPI0026256BD1|nr:hypothetical protein [Spirosoma sp.]MCX6216587.1 hypothetical protein [Spirosoma sp.]